MHGEDRVLRSNRHPQNGTKIVRVSGSDSRSSRSRDRRLLKPRPGLHSGARIRCRGSSLAKNDPFSQSLPGCPREVADRLWLEGDDHFCGEVSFVHRTETVQEPVGVDISRLAQRPDELKREFSAGHLSAYGLGIHAGDTCQTPVVRRVCACSRSFADVPNARFVVHRIRRGHSTAPLRGAVQGISHTRDHRETYRLGRGRRGLGL